MHSFILNVFVYTTALRSEKISYLLFDKKNFANIYLLFILLFFETGSPVHKTGFELTMERRRLSNS